MDGWSLFITILIIVLIALVITFFLLWIGKGTSNRALTISGVNFSLPSSDKITATWASVGSSSDVVTLYASTSPINFSSGGFPEPGQNVFLTPTVSGSAKTLTVGGLTPNTKYYVDLVVTNPNVVGFNPTPDIIYTGADVPSTSFIITEINTRGGISVDVNDNTTVTYDTVINKGLNDIWTYDPQAFTLTTQGIGRFSGTTPALYNNNGVLAAADLKSLQSSNMLSMAHWVYVNNNWCLKSDPTKCMTLPLPAQNGASIAVTQHSTSKWINVPSAINLAF